MWPESWSTLLLLRKQQTKTTIEFMGEWQAKLTLINLHDSSPSWHKQRRMMLSYRVPPAKAISTSASAIKTWILLRNAQAKANSSSFKLLGSKNWANDLWLLVASREARCDLANFKHRNSSRKQWLTCMCKSSARFTVVKNEFSWSASETKARTKSEMRV